MKGTAVFSNNKRMAAFASIAALAMLGTGLVAPAASAAETTDSTVSDASLSWGLSKMATGGSWVGGCNFLSAGKAGKVDAGKTSMGVWTTQTPQPGYQSADGNVSIKAPDASGKLTVTPTWDTKCLTPTGAQASAYVGGNGTSTDATVNFSKGVGTVNAKTNTADIKWTGSFTVAFYGGMTYWFASDPELKVNADGTATLTADLGGYASDRNNPGSLTDIPVAKDQTIAQLKNVKVTDNGFTVTPEYDSIKTTEVPGGGSWPQDFVSFQDKTGQSSYWYNSGTSDANAKAKSPTPITVAYTAKAPEPVVNVPGAPAKPTATAVNGGMADPYQVKIDWKAPADNGGSAITGYTVTLTPSTGKAVTKDVDANTTSVTFGKLTTPSVSYTATVVAKNIKGSSQSSAASNAVVANADPTSTPAITATPTENIDPSKSNTFTVSGTGFTGGAAAYGTYAFVIDSSLWKPGQTFELSYARKVAGVSWVKPAQITDGKFTATVDVAAGKLEYGKTYVVGTVAAHQLAPTDRRLDAAQAITLKAQIPTAPSDVTIAKSGESNATVSWKAPAAAANDSKVAKYTVVVSDKSGKQIATKDVAAVADQQGYVVTFDDVAKPATTLTATVTAVDAKGQQSAAVKAASELVTPAVAPSAPNGVTITAGVHELTAGWTAPYDGGSAITGYTVTLTDKDGKTSTVTVKAPVTQTTFKDLDPTSEYTVSVAAVNAVGTGEAATSAATKPQAIKPTLSFADADKKAITSLTLNAAETKIVYAVVQGELTGDVTVNWESSDTNVVAFPTQDADAENTEQTAVGYDEQSLIAGEAGTAQVTITATVDGTELSTVLPVTVKAAASNNGGNSNNGGSQNGGQNNGQSGTTSSGSQSNAGGTTTNGTATSSGTTNGSGTATSGKTGSASATAAKAGTLSKTGSAVMGIAAVTVLLAAGAGVAFALRRRVMR
ncbi:Fibronectin type III domain-containing protein [Bifidobacterium margollesii]|uniref:Fibronectin type III domain-containing protein n=1 Tax=Bifidobacterium margollesii TaxID=2020964 RepID=A0A2N5J925_9BIFI|nr:fibronectin type III domain-containing protein [Bifidobacterium margollesii]PLS30718.1 Fibronectin type III domain-containing protein [Bifidobacterium margollesii]